MDHAPNGENGFETEADALLAAVALDAKAGVVTHLEALCKQWRRYAVTVCERTLPDAYATYRAIKYADGATATPDLATRREAYLFAACAVLERWHAHPLCEAWRQVAVRVVQALDSAAYATYRGLKDGGSGLACKLKAYRFMFQRFLELGYTVTDL